MIGIGKNIFITEGEAYLLIKCFDVLRQITKETSPAFPGYHLGETCHLTDLYIRSRQIIERYDRWLNDNEWQALTDWMLSSHNTDELMTEVFATVANHHSLEDAAGTFRADTGYLLDGLDRELHGSNRYYLPVREVELT